MSLENIPYFAFSNEIMTKFYDNRFSNFHSSSSLINSDILYYRKLLSSHSLNQIALINLYEKKSKMVNLHQSLLWNDLIKQDKSCVFKIAIHSKSINDMQDYVSHIRHNHDLQMIIIWSSIRDRKIFIQLTKGISDRHWFWYTDRTFVNTDPLNYFDIDKRFLDSHVFVSNPIFKYSILNKRIPYSKMKYNLNKKAYHDIITDPWVKKLIEQRGLNARSENMFKMFDENKSLIDEHIEQLLNILWWSQPWRRLANGPLNKFWNFLNRKTQVSAYKYIHTNESRYFLPRKILFNDIFTKKHGSRHGICVNRNCPPGYEPHKAIFYDATWQTVFDWRCIKCRDKHIKPLKHNEPCKICPRYFVPDKNRSACFDPYNDLYIRPSDTTAIIGIVINLLG